MGPNLPAGFFVPLRRQIWIPLALAAVSLPAATLEQLTLEALARESTAIVQGRVTAERTVQSGALLYTVKTIEVRRTWKGTEASTVEVSLPGGRLGGQEQRFGGAPRLEPDRDYVLFLWTGPSGRTQLTGFSQGVCEILRGADGSLRAVRRPSSDVVLAPDGAASGGDGALDLPLTELSRKIESALAGAGAP